MKLIWHIIKKDIRRDRWALLLYAFLFAGQVGLGLVLLRESGGDRERIIHMEAANGVLIFLQVVVGYILVARLVQADELLGSRMFWRTRPISGARLLGAKAAGAVFLFGLLPVLLFLPWWLWCGFGLRDIWWAAVETFGWQLLMMAPAFLVASLTDDLGRVLLWTLLLIVGLMAWFVLLQASFPVITQDLRFLSAPGMTSTPLALIGYLFVVSLLAVVMHQYLTRRFVRSVALAFASLGLVVLAGELLARHRLWQLAEARRPVLVPETTGLTADISLQLENAEPMGIKSVNGRERTLRITVKVAGLPDDVGITNQGVMQARQTWRWSDGTSLSRDRWAGGNQSFYPSVMALQRYLSLPAVVEDQETLDWYARGRRRTNVAREARGLKPLPVYSSARLANNEQGIQIYTTLAESILNKMTTEPPAFEATIEGVVTRPEVVLELPLKVGARASGQANTVRLMALSDDHYTNSKLETKMDRRKVMLVATEPSLRSRPLFSIGAFIPVSRFPFRNELFIVNHSTGDVTSLNSITRPGHQAPAAMVGGVVIAWREAAVGPFNWIRDGVFVSKDPKWLEHTTLVMLTEREVARFVREIKTDRLELEPSGIEK